MNMQNSRLSKDTLVKMLNAEVETSPEILESLSHSGSKYVRLAVAGNIHTSFETLTRLTHSKIEEVREAAKRNLKQKKILSKLESMMEEHTPAKYIINIFAQEVSAYNLEELKRKLKTMDYSEGEIEEGVEQCTKNCLSKISDRTVTKNRENPSAVSNMIGQLKALDYPAENIVKVLRKVGRKRHKQRLRSYSDACIFYILEKHYDNESIRDISVKTED